MKQPKQMKKTRFWTPGIPPPTNLVGWWPMDETSGSIAHDTVSGMHGNMHFNPGSTVFIPGKFGGGFHFHHYHGQGGPGERVIIPHNQKLNFGKGSFTIDAWIALMSMPTLRSSGRKSPTKGTKHLQPATIFSKIGLYSPGGYEFMVDPNGHLWLRLRLGGGNVASVMTAGSILPLAEGNWTHVAVRVNRISSGTFVTFFVNGQPVPNVNNDPGPVTTIDASIDNTAAAQMGEVGAHFRHMYLDEVEVFNRALGDNEILDIATKGKRKPISPATPTLMPAVPIETSPSSGGSTET